MKIHDLKILPEYAALYYEGSKFWEIRLNDRNFKENDFIRFTIIGSKRQYIRRILYVFDDASFGLEKNYCILSLSSFEGTNFPQSTSV